MKHYVVSCNVSLQSHVRSVSHTHKYRRLFQFNAVRYSWFFIFIWNFEGIEYTCASALEVLLGVVTSGLICE